MKKKTLNKKLRLEKQTIANLENDEIGMIKAGVVDIPPVPTPGWTYTACSNCETQCMICYSTVFTCP